MNVGEKDGFKLFRYCKRGVPLCLAAAWIALSLSSSDLSGEVIDQVGVVIDGEPYTLTEIRGFAREKLRLELSNEDLTRVSAESKAVLEGFITDKLIAAEVKGMGIKVSDRDIDGYIAMVKRRNRITDDQLDKIVHREGLDMKQYRASIRAQLERRELINRQVQKKVNITPEDVERYYRANQDKYRTKEKVHLRHILIRIPEDATPEQEKAAVAKAMEIRRRALRGEDFSQLAREFSEGGGASEGGDIGWVDRASLLAEIAGVAFEMPSGEISGPIRTSLGVHLVKVEARQRAGLLPLSQVAKKIKQTLYAKTLDERFQKWLRTDLRKRHRVDVKLAGFVFRAEEAKKGTVRSLMASRSSNDGNQRSGFLSYLNPLSYFVSEVPIEDDEGENLGSEKVVSLFGIPLFVTESADDNLPEETLPPPDEAQGTGEDSASDSEESAGFLSSVWDSINPF